MFSALHAESLMAVICSVRSLQYILDYSDEDVEDIGMNFTVSVNVRERPAAMP